MKNLKKLMFFSLLLIVLVFACPHTSTNVYAEEVEKNYVVDSKDVDEKLYAVLCDIKDTKTLYQKDFIDDISLDLTIVDNLTSLKGLHLFRFDALQILNVTGNRLISVSKENLSSMPNLTTLYLGGNINPVNGKKLESVDLSNLTKLTTIDLRSNGLTSINLSSITNSLDVNISNNDFTSFNNITLPSNAPHTNINIIGNNITDIPNSYLTSEKLTINGGVQGVKSEQLVTINKKANLCYYNTNIEGLEVRIYNKINDELVKTIVDSEDGKTEVGLDVGKYYYRYYLNSDLAYDDENINDRNSYIKSIYKGYDFIILPNAPTYNFEHKGQTYEKIDKVTGAVTVNLFKSSENDKLYYKLSGEDWKEGDKIICDDGGNYNITIKSVCIIDGEEYESESVEIFIKTSLNTVISDGLMLVIVLSITLTLFFVVVPIVSKKFFKKK